MKKQRSQRGPMICDPWEGLDEFSETCREQLVLVSYLQLSDFLLGLPVTLQRRVEFTPKGLHGAVQRRLPPQTHTVITHRHVHLGIAQRRHSIDSYIATEQQREELKPIQYASIKVS